MVGRSLLRVFPQILAAKWPLVLLSGPLFRNPGRSFVCRFFFSSSSSPGTRMRIVEDVLESFGSKEVWLTQHLNTKSLPNFGLSRDRDTPSIRISYPPPPALDELIDWPSDSTYSTFLWDSASLPISPLRSYFSSILTASKKKSFPVLHNLYEIKFIQGLS